MNLQILLNCLLAIVCFSTDSKSYTALRGTISFVSVNIHNNLKSSSALKWLGDSKINLYSIVHQTEISLNIKWHFTMEHNFCWLFMEWL